MTNLTYSQMWAIIKKYRLKIISIFAKGFEHNPRVKSVYHSLHQYDSTKRCVVSIDKEKTDKIDRMIEIFEYLSRLDDLVILDKYTNYLSLKQPINECLVQLRDELKEIHQLSKEVSRFDKEIKLARARELWKQLSYIAIDDDDCIDQDFLDFEKGTVNTEIWHWFEEEFDVSVVEDLMYGED